MMKNNCNIKFQKNKLIMFNVNIELDNVSLDEIAKNYDYIEINQCNIINNGQLIIADVTQPPKSKIYGYIKNRKRWQ
jgi:hypothetical protein